MSTARKFISMVLALMMVLSLCSFASAESTEVIELELLYHKSEQNAKDAMQAAIDRFNELNPDIHVTMTPTTDFGTAITTRAQSNTLPDLYATQTTNTMDLLFDDGKLMDLTGMDFLNNVEESTLVLTERNGHYYRLPYALSAYGLYIRSDIFAENNLEIPTTWDELMDVCEKLEAAGVTPFVFPNKTMVYQRMERMMGLINPTDDEFKAIAAGELAPEDSTVLQAYAKASVDMAKYTTASSAGAEYTESYQGFIKGDAAMTINGQWSLASLYEYAPDLQLAFVPLPNPAGGDSAVAISVDISFGACTTTQYPDECLRFLAFMAEPETAQIFCDIEGSPCVIKGINYNNEAMTYMMDAINDGRIYLSLNAIWPSGMRGALGEAATNLLLDIDDEDAVANFYEECGEIIEEYYNN